MEEEIEVQRVMSEEQIEQLRKQIVAYTVISERLLQMHAMLNTTTTTYNFVPQALASSKSRQRWSPTLSQLQMLERIFAEENGNPSRQRIGEITALLIPHGPVSDTNVYNWFQNRRARTKRKQNQLPSCSSLSPPLPQTDSLLEAQVNSYLQEPDHPEPAPAPAPGQQHSNGSKADMREAGKSYYNPYDLREQIKWIKNDALH